MRCVPCALWQDGKISSSEWGMAVFKRPKLLKTYFGNAASENDIASAFERIDRDGSGYLDWDEFLTGAQRGGA